MKFSFLIPVIYFVFIPAKLPAQFTGVNTYAQSDKNGSWTFTLYDAHILKTTFLPTNYKTNEQVSNAVIIKPGLTKIRYPAIEVLVKKNDGIHYTYSGKKIVLKNYFDSGLFRGFRFLLGEGEQVFGARERSIPLS